MNRDELIKQVKQGYEKLAMVENRDTFIEMGDITQSSEAYYEKLLSRVIDKINTGEFDGFSSGQEIIEAVANNKVKYETL